MQETKVRSLGSKGPLEEEMVTHYSILAWRIPACQASVYRVAQSRTRLKQLSTYACIHLKIMYISLKKKINPLNQFLIAAVTNYRKVCGLKQHKCFILNFGLSEVQNESQWPNIKLSAVSYSLPAPRGKNEVIFATSSF